MSFAIRSRRSGAAREKVRVAHALVKLPRISVAIEKGELSYSKVRELTRVACERTEEYLLSIALHGTAHHVETLVRGFRRCKDAEELKREAQQQASRSVHYRFEDDGSLVLKARLPAEIGAMVLKAIQTAMDHMPLPDVPAGTSEQKPGWAARRADALGLVAESFMEHGASALNGGDRNLVTVHVAAETLRNKTAGCCEIEEGPSISAETARRLACDASVVAIVENDQGEPLNVGVAPDHVRSFDWTHLPADNEERGIHINARTAATRWVGESMDYGLGVQVLLQQAKRSKNIPAGTSKTLRGDNDR
jgi:hypothetical protein